MKRIAQVITRMVAGGAAGNVRALMVAGLGRFDFTLFTGPEDVTEPDLAPLRELCQIVVIPAMIRAVHPVADYRAYRQLCREFRKGRFDVVHTHTSKAGFLGRMAAAQARVPVVIHSPEGTIYAPESGIPGIPTGGFRLRWLQAAEQLAGRHTTWLTPLSENEKEICVRLGLSRTENTVVIPNGIDLAAFAPRVGERAAVRQELGLAENDLLFLSVGRLSREKGHDLLVEAFVKVAARLPRARLMIVGDGPERQPLIAAGVKHEILNPKSETGNFRQDGQDKQDKSESRKPKSETGDFASGSSLSHCTALGEAHVQGGSGLPPANLRRQPALSLSNGEPAPTLHRNPPGRILFPGHRDDVRRLLAATDLFVLPSRYEGFGLAVIEAMASGVPVIASRVGGVPEIIRDGVDGCLVPGGEVAALAEAICRLANDAPERQRLGRAGQLRSQAFSREPMLEAYYRLYQHNPAEPGLTLPGTSNSPR